MRAKQRGPDAVNEVRAAPTPRPAGSAFAWSVGDLTTHEFLPLITCKVYIHPCARIPCMVLPPIPPLPPKVWDEFMAALERGPTPEQVRAVEAAKEIARRIRVKDPKTVKSEAFRPPHFLSQNVG